MVDELVVRFRNSKGKREAVFRPGNGLRAVFLPGEAGADTAKKMGLNFVAGPAPGVVVTDGSGVAISGAAAAGEEGPGICCIVAGDLHCW